MSRNSPTLASTSDSRLPSSWGMMIRKTSTNTAIQTEFRVRCLGSPANSRSLILPTPPLVRSATATTRAATASAAHHSSALRVNTRSATTSNRI